MLTFHGFEPKGPLEHAAPAALAQASWIDAFDPSTEEVDRLTRALGVAIPTLADLEEIESSSRLAVEGDAIVMSLTATVRDETGFPKTTPIGFVLTPDRVLTIRFERLPSFDGLVKQIAAKGGFPKGGFAAAVVILENLVDHIADGLERIGGELDMVSKRIFGGDMVSAKTRRPRQTSEAMKGLLQTVGRSGDLASRISQTLLGLSRMAPFVLTHAEASLTPDDKSRLDIIARDVKSLYDFEEHLTNKTQFLLDTLLGLANIEQNNVFRVLTVVSVVGIPPTFFASLWGMNFKTMPELDWPHGYTMGLCVIAISAVAPAVWFKVKGWW